MTVKPDTLDVAPELMVRAAMVSGAVAGRVAAAAVRDGVADPGTRYRADLARATGRHRRHMAVAARLATIPRAMPAGIDEADRDQGVFDDFVEMGLADGLITTRLVRAAARRTWAKVPVLGRR